MQLSWVEELGSGVLNVSKYWQVYSNGTKPEFIEGATFKIVLPLSDHFFIGNQDSNQDGNQDGKIDSIMAVINKQIADGVNDGVNDGVRKEMIELVTLINSNEGLKTAEIATKRGKSKPTIERYLKQAKQLRIIEYRGSPKTGGYYITKLLKDTMGNKSGLNNFI
jgi:ATP-dependent DNA helicase RecG